VNLGETFGANDMRCATEVGVSEILRGDPIFSGEGASRREREAIYGYTVIDPYHPSRYYGNAEGLNFPQNASITVIWNLPWFREAHGLKRLVLGGWQYSDITTFRSGVSATAGLSVANQGIAVHPDATGQPIKGPQKVSQWFNTAAYKAPQPGYYGNASIGTIRDPGLVDFDMALYKNFRIWESHEFQFRAEAFNVFNHPNFANVVTTVGNSNYGQVTSARSPHPGVCGEISILKQQARS
jgi:hypothetical protein